MEFSRTLGQLQGGYLHRWPAPTCQELDTGADLVQIKVGGESRQEYRFRLSAKQKVILKRVWRRSTAMSPKLTYARVPVFGSTSDLPVIHPKSGLTA